MKKRNSLIITIIFALMLAVPILTDNSFVNSIIENVKGIAASINNSEKATNSQISIDPELLAIPYTNSGDIVIHHNGFSLLYSEKYEQAAWVGYLLTKKEVFGKIPRSNNFREDPTILSGSAKLEDYKGSGYDRGHLAPAGDLKWSKISMKDSFYLSNMSPQAPGFNRDLWRRLEEWVRTQTVNNKELIVVTGPVLTDGPFKKIGIDEVAVPKRYFKVLLDFEKPEIKAIGFIMENRASKKPVTDFAVTVDTVEETTGIDFFYLLPDTLEDKLESQNNIKLWQ
ncbi:MAG: DNA/RNA non-specific endonuclease [Spirochaetaceae bacterium]|nr:DNA/RNA non-specific endonuclease [Spirochaetaceae bacterium]